MNWTERDQAVVWHGFTQMECYADNAPVIVERGEGRELIDVNGRRYLDAFSSLWVTTLGHRVPELDQALREQIDRIAHSTLLGNGSRIVVELAEALAAVVPVDSPHFVFASDGAAAVEQALKIAFQYWTNLGIKGRNRYLAFGGAYHGDTVGSLSVGAGGFGTDVFNPLRFPVIRAPSFHEPRAFERAAELIERHRSELAAVIIEPLVQGAAGMQFAVPEEVHRIAEACARNDVLLICDEVATGFGRTGSMFASEQCRMRPDLMCLGKGITGGYLPMSATVASQRVFAAFLGPDLSERTFYHGHSYGGNALAASVALRHLQLFKELNVLDNVQARSKQLRSALDALGRKHSFIEDIRLVGLMGALQISEAAGASRTARKICAAMVRRGVLTRSLGNVVTLVPPLTITAAEIGRIVDALAVAIDEVVS